MGCWRKLRAAEPHPRVDLEAGRAIWRGNVSANYYFA
jgi:hypothetical protein